MEAKRDVGNVIAGIDTGLYHFGLVDQVPMSYS